MIDKAVAIIEATRAGELLPRLTDNREDWRCRMCGHRERCYGV
jgi:rubrerythrin